MPMKVAIIPIPIGTKVVKPDDNAVVIGATISDVITKSILVLLSKFLKEFS